jgi:hypothetical protein
MVFFVAKILIFFYTNKEKQSRFDDLQHFLFKKSEYQHDFYYFCGLKLLVPE